jgi:hypothetical protein
LAVVPVIFSRNIFSRPAALIGAGFVLGSGRDARISVNHATNFASVICIEKAQSFQTFDSDADILISGAPAKPADRHSFFRLDTEHRIYREQISRRPIIG